MTMTMNMMKGSVSMVRNLSLLTRRLCPFNPTPSSSSSPFSLSLFASTSRFFSYRNTPSNPPPHSSHKNDPIDVDDITNEELKRRVAKLREGDDKAIPSVFEAILQRSLAGKPIEDDQELMREILGKGTSSEDEDDESDYSDLEGMSDIDDGNGHVLRLLEQFYFHQHPWLEILESFDVLQQRGRKHRLRNLLSFFSQ